MSCFVNLYNGTKGKKWNVTVSTPDGIAYTEDDVLVYKADCGPYKDKYIFYSSNNPVDTNEPWMIFSIKDLSDYFSPILGHVVGSKKQDPPVEFKVSDDKKSYSANMPGVQRRIKFTITPMDCKNQTSNVVVVEGSMQQIPQPDFIAGVY